MHFVEKYNIKWVKIILIAPVYPWLAEDWWKEVFWEAYENISKYFNKDIDFNLLKENEFITFLSDNDLYINMEKAKDYLGPLKNIKFVEFKSKWSFNQWAWILDLKEILEYIV